VSVLITADIFLSPITGKIAGGNTTMIVQRGKGTYVYKTERVNGTPMTHYLGKRTSPQAKEYEKRKEEKKQLRNREEDLQRLNEELENALKIIKITEKAFLLLAGYYERKSELSFCKLG
jgi:hypothetical protein